MGLGESRGCVKDALSSCERDVGGAALFVVEALLEKQMVPYHRRNVNEGA